MYFLSVVLQNLVYGTQILMVAVAIYFVLSSSRIIHVALGAIGTFSAYIIYLGIISGWPFWLSAVFALFLTLALGLISAELLEPFVVRREPLIGLIVSLALVIVIESVIAIFFGTDGKSLQQGILPVLDFGGVSINLPGVVTILLGMFLAVISWLAITFTKTGRLLRSVSENFSLAASLGINNKNIRRLAHCLAALTAAVVMTLVGWHSALTPLMGFNIVVIAFIALMIGGDLRGAVISSYVLAIIPGLVIGFSNGISEDARLIIVFLLAAIFLAVRPSGIFGKKLREA